MATEFKLPEVGEGIEGGTVVSVLVSVGDRVEVDQPVVELETDKAVVEVPSSLAGVVESLAVTEGEEAAVGSVIMTVDEQADGAAPADTDAEAETEAASADAEPAAPEKGAEAQRTPQEASPAAGAGADGDGARRAPAGGGAVAGAPEEAAGDAGEARPMGLLPAAPSVRRLAREVGVDLRAVQGSGILGRISAEDVRAFAEGHTPGRAPAQAPAAPAGGGVPAPSLPDFSKWGPTERVAMSGIRKATVRSMRQAWATVPMVTHFDKADITEFESLRKRYQPRAEAMGTKLTPTAMLVKIVAASLRKFPAFNASIDAEAEEVVYKKYVNIGVAVDTEHGLLVPVIRDADAKNMLQLAVELGELAERARDRKLSPEEMQGGNFSVSNLGGIGGTGFTPIVNPPDVAILGVSRGGYEPVWDREAETFVPRMMMPLSVTYDHRLIDGASAARFLRWVCQAVEEPFLMSLEG